MKAVSLLALLVTTAWAATSPGFDSVSAFLFALAAYWTLDRPEPAAVAELSPEAHDQRLFANYEDILSEAQLAAELATNLGDCRTTSDFLQRIEDWCRLARSTSGPFLSERLQSSMENYRAWASLVSDSRISW